MTIMETKFIKKTVRNLSLIGMVKNSTGIRSMIIQKKHEIKEGIIDGKEKTRVFCFDIMPKKHTIKKSIQLNI